MAKVQRRWKSQVQQHALVDFDLVRQTCPEGIYLCLTPGNFALWSGVLFVRKGPYAPAVLRFQLAFPQNYPEVPPLILFTNDVFHPLVTPLTTYTFSTSASSADPVSATDEERLLPGGFSLRHGFPSWFAHSAKSKLGHVGSLVSQSNQTGANEATQRAAIAASSGSSSGPGPPQSVFLPPPKDEGSSVEEALPTILEVLRYIKDVFEDETLLDELPIEAAGNPGAWHAWQAHRKRTKSSKSSADGLRSQLNTPRKEKGAAAKLRAAGWNWDGVWAERVKKGVSNSLTDSMLYGGVDGDDLIHFLDLDGDASDRLRKPFASREPGVS